MNKPESEHEKSPLAEREENILAFWHEKDIFKKSLEKDSPKGEFIFYEGPPTANGRPGIHHVEARAFKDIIPRYKTMQGFHVRRKGGWDTHGLPVELEVEKKLDLKSKKDIEKFGIAEFNKKCKESVWTYIDEWQSFTKRMGYWIDLDNPYVTYDPSYMESLWNIVKTINDKGYLYKDYRVVPWCSRCGTALSSHELAQGYQDVKDLSVYVKFKLINPEKHGLLANTFVLAWTTTPWTLPGNVALAMGKDIVYTTVEVGEERYVVADALVEKLFGPDAKKDRSFTGKDLIGAQYESLYSYLEDNLPESEKNKFDRAFHIYDASFVTTDDGTGIVHTAVMYGQDDFELGTYIGLPKYHLVDDTGHFTSEVTLFAGKFVKDEETAVDIIKDLAHRGLLFKKEKYEHSYPFCWRCKTPLIYYARDSWYVRMSSLRDTLVAENKKIHWEPDYIQEGRFGEWLREIKDWAFSRERYWGTPLPIWRCEECKKIEVIGSIEDLHRHTKRNTFFVMRHGEAENNVHSFLSCNPSALHDLTEKGKDEVREALSQLQDKKIDLIISSDLTRTKETAELIQSLLNLPKENLIFDERLREYNFGEYDTKSINEWHSYWATKEWGDVTARVPGGESPRDVLDRVALFIEDINSKYKDKNILIVSHNDPIRFLAAYSEGKNITTITRELWRRSQLQNAEVRVLPFAHIPRNDEKELDLHRPYIDEVSFGCDCGGIMKRIPEVIDVWFDSGSMPFAEDHYPFENKEYIDTMGYPADYIAEAIDQTRGWFYTLHAVGNLLGKGRAYKNVVSLGHILDKSGKKMSKSLGNTVNPWEMIDKYGVDALRFWMYSVNQPGDSKNFDEKTVDEVVRKVPNLLLNVLSFYEMYADKEIQPSRKSPSTLDQWVIALLDELTLTITKGLDAYTMIEASRAVRDFIADFSQWYVRRSRDRFKGESAQDKRYSLSITRYILQELSKLMAPFMPFLAEDIYQKVKGKDGKESVHLEQWPQIESVNEVILEQMNTVRTIVSLALEARSKAQIKIRQPLSKLTIKNNEIAKNTELEELIKDEVNVKEVIIDTSLQGEVGLDITITPELKREGQAREFIRALQDLRKKTGLNPQDHIKLTISTSEEGKALVEEFISDIKKTAQVIDVSYSATQGEKVSIDDLSFVLSIVK